MYWLSGLVPQTLQDYVYIRVSNALLDENPPGAIITVERTYDSVRVEVSDE
jgi:hypothetical protein